MLYVRIFKFDKNMVTHVLYTWDDVRCKKEVVCQNGWKEVGKWLTQW